MVDQIHGMVTYIHKHREKRWARKCVGRKNRVAVSKKETNENEYLTFLSIC